MYTQPFRNDIIKTFSCMAEMPELDDETEPVHVHHALTFEVQKASPHYSKFSNKDKSESASSNHVESASDERRQEALAHASNHIHEAYDSHATGRSRPPRASQSIKYITLNFVNEKDTRGEQINIPSLPLTADWETASAALRSKFGRLVHFRYEADANVWRDVCGSGAWQEFKLCIARLWGLKSAAAAVVDVYLLRFGTGRLVPSVMCSF
jgi:hypothetical protein